MPPSEWAAAFASLFEGGGPRSGGGSDVPYIKKNRLLIKGPVLVFGRMNQAFSRARVRVVTSQTSLGPQYWMAPG